MACAYGEVEAVEGVQKNVLNCNWKIAVDNLFDWYHVKVSHNSASRVGFLNQAAMMPMTQMVMLGELGHAIGGPMITREQQAKARKVTKDPALMAWAPPPLARKDR